MSDLLTDIINNSSYNGSPIIRPAINLGSARGSGECHAIDMTTGSAAIMTAGDLPWHNLGQNVRTAVNSADAIRLSRTDWEAWKLPLYAKLPDGSFSESHDKFGIVRADTGAVLGVVGSKYQPVQNTDGFAFLDDVLKSYGATYETAGALFGGRKVWMLAKLPSASFTVGNLTDKIDTYVLFTNSHDGTASAYAYPTSVRVVCNNTFRLSTQDRSKGISIRHTGSVKDKLADASQVLATSLGLVDQFRDDAIKMSETQCDPVQFIDNLLDQVLEVTAADVADSSDLLTRVLRKSQANAELANKKVEALLTSRTKIKSDIVGRLSAPRNQLAGMPNTAWQAFNAVTEYADHAQPARKRGDEESRDSRRFESVISGEADTMKQLAYQQAMSLSV